MRLLFWVAFAAAAAVAAVALGRDEELQPRAATPVHGPLLAVQGVYDAATELVRLRPGTLRRASAPIPIHDWLWGSAWAPDGRRLALAADGAIQIVDTGRWRKTARIALGRNPYSVAWPAPRRVLALGRQQRAGQSVLVVDPVAHRVVRRLRIGGQAIGDGFRETAAGFAMLVGPPDRIGPATLVLVSADGGMRRVPLDGIRGGFRPPDLRRDPNGLGRQIVPGLAVDERGERVFVISADDGAVVQVGVRDGTAVRHEPAVRRSALAFLRDLVEPAAEAKISHGPWRSAAVIGDTLAISGHDASGRRRPDPAGLTLVDTRDWTAEKVDDRASTVLAAGDVFVAGDDPGRGVVAYEPDGSRRFTELEGRNVWVQAAGGRLYADAAGPSRTHVLDAGTGREIRRVRGETPVLIPPPR